MPNLNSIPIPKIHHNSRNFFNSKNTVIDSGYSERIFVKFIFINIYADHLTARDRLSAVIKKIERGQDGNFECIVVHMRPPPREKWDYVILPAGSGPRVVRYPMIASVIRSPPTSDGSIGLANAAGSEQTSRRSIIGNLRRKASSVITSLKNDRPVVASICHSVSRNCGL